ncbi:MAG: septum formation initiator family protein [Candidatus Omnitrophica bacterium]|nr:septum formation initiator family protein [Candidatus Omnitrophota bacterium]
MIKILKKYNFFIIIFLLGVISLISVFSKYQDLAQKNRELKIEMKQLAAENRALKKRQHKLQNDPVFAESVAREKLKVALEGEVIYKILPEE